MTKEINGMTKKEGNVMTNKGIKKVSQQPDKTRQADRG